MPERPPYNVVDIADVEAVKAPDACGYCGEPVAVGWYHEACKVKADREHERDVAKARARLARELPPQALKVPDLLAFARRDAEAQRAAVAVGSWRMLDPLPCLYLHGPTGRGKTTLAALALVAAQDEAVAEGRTCSLAFRSAPAIVAKRETPAPPTGAALVVLDDVGRHRLTGLKVERLERFVNALADAGVPMLVTSNLHPLALAEAVNKGAGDGRGAPLVRRLTGGESGQVIEVR